MAYRPDGIKALAAGSAKAPGIFTYNAGDDLLADVTTEGYFDAEGGSGIFEPNDIIYVIYDSATVLTSKFAKIICVQNNRTAPLGQKLDFSTTSSFVGDVRATDETGYVSDNFGVGLGSGQGIFMQFTYRNNTDALAVIGAVSYFDETATFINVGDTIEVVANNGYIMMAVTDVVAGVVTTRDIVFL